MTSLTQFDAKRRKPVEAARRCRSALERLDRGIPSEEGRRGTPLEGSSHTLSLVGQKGKTRYSPYATHPAQTRRSTDDKAFDDVLPFEVAPLTT